MRKANSYTLYWMGITFLLFPVLAILGIYMRTVQAGGLAGSLTWFYPMMTLHGVGMVSVWYVAAMACAADILSRYTEPSPAVRGLALFGTLVGVLILLVSAFLGKFAAGWYFLYPLPFKGEWPVWSAVAFLLSLTILGATWLLWSLDLLRAIAVKYSITHALG